jgi:hypothetical protein
MVHQKRHPGRDLLERVGSSILYLSYVIQKLICYNHHNHRMLGLLWPLFSTVRGTQTPRPHLSSFGVCNQEMISHEYEMTSEIFRHVVEPNARDIYNHIPID